jgi:class 3 adenylate cyclase
MQIPFIQQIIQKHYAQFDEDRKRNVSILIILILMMVFVMGSWALGFVYLKMWEMFWLDFFVWIGYILLFIGAAFGGLPFKIGRFFALTLGLIITGVPSMYYGIDTIVTLHMVFVPLATILLFSRKEKKQFFAYMGVIIGVFWVIIGWNVLYGAAFVVPADTFRIFNTIVALDSMFISLYFAYFFFTENTQYKDLLANEREKSDQLLLSIFPETIADKLRNSNRSVADSFENVTIFFADIVGFSQLASNKNPSEVVAMLDEIFSEFDALVDKYGIEKIKTIGDSYMAVGGLPVPDARHCHNIADMAIEINQIIKEKYTEKYNLQLRIGIHTGKAVAGVIGNKKFSYDLWGDSVNIASRFEASGHPEKIHITEDVKNTLGDAYTYKDCGEVEIKGKGMMRSYFLLGKKKISYKPASLMNTFSNYSII